MNSHPCWRVLGIAPTSDVKAIRRAYATRLKAIDSDRDVAAFEELQEARAEAVYLASSAEITLDEPAGSTLDVVTDRTVDVVTDRTVAVRATSVSLSALRFQHIGLPDDAISIHSQPEIAPPTWDVGAGEAGGPARRPVTADAGWNGVTLDLKTPVPVGVVQQSRDIDADYGALYDLLAADDRESERGFPSPDHAAAMTMHMRHIVNDPRFGQIDFLAEREAWIAEVLSMTWPTSEPLVEIAVEHFGWAAHAGEISQSPAVEFLVQRHNAVAFRAAVTRPGHDLHNAWIELTKPANETSRRGLWVRSSKVARLLSAVRRDYPTLEYEFDSWRVALWDEKVTSPGSSMSWIWLAIVLVITVIRIANPTNSSQTDQAPTAYYGDTQNAPVAAEDEEAVQAAIAGTFSGQLTAARVREENPALFVMLASEAAHAREKNIPASSFGQDVRHIMRLQLERGVALADHELLLELAKARIKQIETMKGVAYTTCARFIFKSDVPPPNLPRFLADEQAELDLRVLMQTDGKDPISYGQEQKTTKLDGDLVDRIRQTSGVPESRLKDALLGKGSDRDRCETHLATIREISEEPPSKADPLLRAVLFGV